MWNRSEMEINGTVRKGHIVSDHFFVFKNKGWRVYHIDSGNFITNYFPTMKKKNEIEGFMEHILTIGLNWDGKTAEEVFSVVSRDEAYEKINEYFKE